MFYCARCGIRFSVGALSGETDCPRCKARDGVVQPLRAERLRPIERLGGWHQEAMRPREGRSPQSFSDPG
jgi:hypothetical protein